MTHTNESPGFPGRFMDLHEQGLDILWREDGWLGLGADIGAHPLVEEFAEQTEGAQA